MNSAHRVFKLDETITTPTDKQAQKNIEPIFVANDVRKFLIIAASKKIIKQFSLRSPAVKNNAGYLPNQNETIKIKIVCVHTLRL